MMFFGGLLGVAGSDALRVVEAMDRVRGVVIMDDRETKEMKNHIP